MQEYGCCAALASAAKLYAADALVAKGANAADAAVERAVESQDSRSKSLLITGSSGLIGSALISFLRDKNFKITRLVRGESQAKDAIAWDPAKGYVPMAKLEGFDAVVHLAGENIAGIWTKRKREHLFISRCRDTWLLAEALSKLDAPPKAFIGASAVGIYGSRGDEALTEKSRPGKGFLADLCHQWEKASYVLEHANVRVVRPRFGIVLSKTGGMLKGLIPFFRLSLGAKLGDGFKLSVG